MTLVSRQMHALALCLFYETYQYCEMFGIRCFIALTMGSHSMYSHEFVCITWYLFVYQYPSTYY